MNATKQRKTIVFKVNNIESAKQKCLALLPPAQQQKLTVINATKDHNQNKWLGKELNDTLIYIDPHTKINNILSVTGCVKGGCFVFFALEIGAYPRFYVNFFIPELKKIADKPKEEASARVGKTRHNDKLLQQLKQTAKQNTITHLIGERGTGKSTLLGHYIKSLLNQNESQQIILLSPSKSTSKNTLNSIVPDGEKGVSRETFRFLTEEQINNNICETATHIIVDEAASMAHATLKKIISLASACVVVFATTVDGYEGTGQSYRLSLLGEANRVIWLTEPRRFAYTDPLFLLSQQLCQPQRHASTAQKINKKDGIRICRTQELIDKGWLFPVFCLLKEAHYRTTPNDFANLYDNDAFFVLNIHKNQLIGALLALPEAIEHPSAELLKQVFQNQRRLKNALTQQALISAYGESVFFQKKGLRVSRIAVLADYRRNKQATLMVYQLEVFAKEKGFAFLSASFSGQKKAFSFWASQRFALVRIGNYRNKWHQQFSVLVLKGLDTTMKKETERLNKRCQQHVNFFLSAYQKKPCLCLPTGLFPAGQQKPKPSVVASRQEMTAEIDSVIHYHRDIHWVLPLVFGWMQQQTLPEAMRQAISPYLTGSFLDREQKKKALKALIKVKAWLDNNAC